MRSVYEKIKIKGMSKEQWMELRRTGIGGSDAAAVANMSPFSNPMKVFEDKMGTLVEDVESEKMSQGTAFEDYCARKFSTETGYKVRRSHFMYRSKEFPWMIANVDRFLETGSANKIGLECKCCSVWNKSAWSQGVPVYYYLQVMHYMIVLGIREFYVAVTFLSDSFRYYHVKWDQEVADWLIEVERDFWINNILMGISPSPDGSDICSNILQQRYGEAKRNSQIKLVGFDEMLDKRSELADEISRLQKEQNKIDQEIQVYMKENEKAVSDKYRVLWGNIETTRFDSKRFKEEQPDLYQKYAVTSASRRFQVKVA